MGAVEGFNDKGSVTPKMVYGFKSYEHAEIALFHRLGDPPEPPGSPTDFREEPKLRAMPYACVPCSRRFSPRAQAWNRRKR
jgi:hypothetical protein